MPADALSCRKNTKKRRFMPISWRRGCGTMSDMKRNHLHPDAIRHTVVFRLKHPAGSAPELAFLRAACELADIPGVQHFECLRQVSPKNPFTFGLSMELAEAAAYQFYSGHPDHARFVQERWLPEVAEFMEIDYIAHEVAAVHDLRHTTSSSIAMKTLLLSLLLTSTACALTPLLAATAFPGPDIVAVKPLPIRGNKTVAAGPRANPPMPSVQHEDSAIAQPSTGITSGGDSLAQEGIPLLDAELSKWEIFMGVPHKSVTIPGYAPFTSEDGMHGDTPLGLGQDPLKVFTVSVEDGIPTLRVSGEIFAGLSTREEFENYHLSWQFRWGQKKWTPRLDKPRDSGVLFHCYGAQGSIFNSWMLSFECQIQEGDCADLINISTTADIRVVDTENPHKPRYSPDGELRSLNQTVTHGPTIEKPNGEWNALDIYTVGQTSIMLVNGKPGMVLTNTGTWDRKTKSSRPLTRGKIQIQSEGAEIFYRKMRLTGISEIPDELKHLIPKVASASATPRARSQTPAADAGTPHR
jgi:hypothetical protein